MGQTSNLAPPYMDVNTFPHQFPGIALFDAKTSPLPVALPISRSWPRRRSCLPWGMLARKFRNIKNPCHSSLPHPREIATIKAVEA